MMAFASLAALFFAAAPTEMRQGARVRLNLSAWRKNLMSLPVATAEAELKKFGLTLARDTDCDPALTGTPIVDVFHGAVWDETSRDEVVRVRWRSCNRPTHVLLRPLRDGSYCAHSDHRDHSRPA